MTEVEGKNKICFIDSNVWLYAFIETQDVDKCNIAKSLIQDKNSSIIISTQIINEVCVNLVKKAHCSEESIRELIKSFYRKYEVVEIDKEVLLKASEIRERHSFSFWDSLVVSSALCGDAEILYSEDMQDGFTLEEITIVNPFNKT